MIGADTTFLVQLELIELPAHQAAHEVLQQQIRNARVALLMPLLQKRGLQLIPNEAGNFEVTAYPGLLLKENS